MATFAAGEAGAGLGRAGTGAADPSTVFSAASVTGVFADASTRLAFTAATAVLDRYQACTRSWVERSAVPSGVASASTCSGVVACARVGATVACFAAVTRRVRVGIALATLSGV